MQPCRRSSSSILLCLIVFFQRVQQHAATFEHAHPLTLLGNTLSREFMERFKIKSKPERAIYGITLFRLVTA